MRAASPYVTDPSSAQGFKLSRPIFDASPERNVGARCIPYELAGAPDDLLIATCVAHGMPRSAAEEVRGNGYVRWTQLKFWVDVHDAAKGDPAARERVDYCREMWALLRREQVIADDPRTTVGMFG